MLNIVIRADASMEIGTGHVMRCLTLAKQLKRHGMQVTFICQDLKGNSISYLLDGGIQVIPLSVTSSHFEWEIDARETINILNEMNESIELLIVDQYEIDKRWEKELRPYTKYIMVIDDLADRPHDCDLLLDQNYYLDMEERYKELVPNHCKQMLGPNYALLRDEFLLEIEKPRERTGEIKNILVFFGGTDPTEETIKTLYAIKDVSLFDVEINVVVGQSNPNRLEIEQMCRKLPNTAFYCQINNMAELMNEADLAIGAGGSAIWERCYVNLPSIVLITAKNQQEVSKAVYDFGAIYNLGEASLINGKDIQQAIINLMTNLDLYLGLIRNSNQLLNKSILSKYPVVKHIIKMLE